MYEQTESQKKRQVSTIEFKIPNPQRKSSQTPLSLPSFSTFPESNTPQTFYTPQQIKNAKPLPAAFNSTGLISKNNRPTRHNHPKPTPETPAKKLNFMHMNFGRQNSLFNTENESPSHNPIRAMDTEQLSLRGTSLIDKDLFSSSTKKIRNISPYQSDQSKINYSHPLSLFNQNQTIKSEKISQQKTPLHSNIARYNTNNESPTLNNQQSHQKNIHLLFDESPIKSVKKPALDFANYVTPKKSTSIQQSQFDTPIKPSPKLATKSSLATTLIAPEKRAINPQFSNLLANTILDSPSSKVAPQKQNYQLTPVLKSRSRCFSSPETRSHGLFSPSYTAIRSHLSPVKQFDIRTRLHDPVHKDTSSTLSSLSFTASNPQHYIYTPYPRFITPEVINNLRYDADHSKPLFSTHEDITPDYFDQNFHIVTSLGCGEFSHAYKVINKTDGCYYAVKKSLKPYSGHKDRIAKLEEVEMMWCLKRFDHCVKLFAAWEQYGHLYLQMELCEGGNLKKYIDDATRLVPLEEHQILQILRQITQGLCEIHSRNIVHLDIKPANVFIEKDRLKIGDFGQASFSPVAEGREGDQTYMAPETLNGKLYTFSADIFSLGLVILEIVGNVDLPENGDVWKMLRSGNLQEVNLGRCSHALEALVRSMLSVSPEKRPSAQAILNLLGDESLAEGDEMEL